ncbi:MAG: hypothetical protein ABSD98_05880 [Candidatus Korobacteraceae bacterium]
MPVNDVCQRSQCLYIPSLVGQLLDSFSQITRVGLQDIAHKLFDRRLQLGNDAVQIGRTLRRYWTITTHVVWRQLRNRNLHEGEIDMDGMDRRAARLLRHQRLPGQYLQELTADPCNIVLNRLALHGRYFAHIIREYSLRSCGTERRFHIPQQLVDVPARDQEVLALACIQRDVVVTQPGSLQSCFLPRT